MSQTTVRSMVPPLERDPRYRTLDVWRGIACLLVVLHHAGFVLLWQDVEVEAGDGSTGLEPSLRWWIVAALRRMDLGVPLFFVISGYCIAASVDATRRRGSSSLFFLSRRVWRIYPPYWAAVLWFLAVIVGLEAIGQGELLGPPYPYALELIRPESLSLGQWLGNLTLTETWRPIVFPGGQEHVFTRIGWSLCYEEQFYLVCFLALLIAPRRLYGALAWATLAIVLFRAIAADMGALHRVWGSFPVLWHEFAVGLAVYWRLNVPASRAAKRGVELGLVALAVVGLLGSPRGTPVEYSTLTTALFGLVLIALRDRDDWAERQGWLAPLRACGRRCYSIYLFHLPVCTVGNLWLYRQGLTGFWERTLVIVPLVSILAVGVCWVFYHLVERHFLNPPIVRREPWAPPSPAQVPVGGEEPAPSLLEERGNST